MRTPPLLDDFIHPRDCKPICEKLLTLPVQIEAVNKKEICLWYFAVKRKITAKLAVIFLKNGGPNRDRTDDLTDANRTLSQLSYRPIIYHNERKTG